MAALLLDVEACGRRERRQAAGEPAVVHEELDGRVDARLQGVGAAGAQVGVA